MKKKVKAKKRSKTKSSVIPGIYKVMESEFRSARKRKKRVANKPKSKKRRSRR
jgi:hypothetical protein